MHKICIDPGHGGTDRANRGPTGYIEADGVLEISKYLKGFMVAVGWDVKLTREDDSFIAIRERARIAAKWGADVFISEHTNACNTKARGTEVFSSVDLQDDVLADNISAAIAKALGIPDRGGKKWESKIHPGEDFLGVIDEAQDLGIKHVFLVETAFHDNAEDEAILKVPINKMKSAIAQGIEICVSMGTPIPMTYEQTLYAQKALNKYGYKLVEDGVYGTQTGAAIMDYEVKNGMPPSGISSMKLLELLSGGRTSNDIHIVVDGVNIDDRMDVKPTIVDGRVLVPIRFIVEALGAQVSWDGTTKTVTVTKG